RAYCLKTQPATGETYPKSDLFNKAGLSWNVLTVEAVIRNEKWNSYDGNEMMEHHFTSILDRLDIQFQDILALVQKIVVAYKRFWEMADPELVNFALNPCPMLSKLTWNERRKYLGD
ncbi:hypothetical protein, partial [Klebsiella pneumoniae]